MDPIIRGPFAFEINGELVWIQVFKGSVLSSPTDGEELLVINHMKLWGDVVCAEVPN